MLCASNYALRAMACDEIASSKGVSAYPRRAYDHAGFASARTSNWLLRASDAEAIALSSGTSTNASVAKAHAVFERFWTSNSAILPRASAAIA